MWGGGGGGRLTDSDNFYPMMLKLCHFQLLSSRQVLAKLITRGVPAALFSWRPLKNFENEKIFLCLETAEIENSFSGGK